MTKHEEKRDHHAPKHQVLADEPITEALDLPDHEAMPSVGVTTPTVATHAKAAAAAPVAAPTPKLKSSTPGTTLCKVTGTAVQYNGKLFPEGTVAEFDDATVLDMPTVLISVE